MLLLCPVQRFLLPYIYLLTSTDLFLVSFLTLTLISYSHLFTLLTSFTHLIHTLFYTFTAKPAPSVIWFIGNEKIDDSFQVNHTTGNTINELTISPAILSQRLLSQFSDLLQHYQQQNLNQEQHQHQQHQQQQQQHLLTSKNARSDLHDLDLFTSVDLMPFLQITCQVYLDAILFPGTPPISSSIRFDTNCK